MYRLCREIGQYDFTTIMENPRIWVLFGAIKNDLQSTFGSIALSEHPLLEFIYWGVHHSGGRKIYRETYRVLFNFGDHNLVPTRYTIESDHDLEEKDLSPKSVWDRLDE